MNIKNNYTLIALLIVIFINGVLILSDAAGDPSPIPILMLLLLCELGFIISIAGAYYGVKSLAAGFNRIKAVLSLTCAILGVTLAYKGYLFWQSLNLAS